MNDSKGLDMLRKHRRVEIVDDERSIGNNIIVTLKQGWSFDPRCDNRVGGGETAAEALNNVRQAHPFDGPYDP